MGESGKPGQSSRQIPNFAWPWTNCALCSTTGGRAQQTKETILEELEALQEEVAVRLERMKQLVQEK
ncbi:MAG: hypothetical protein WBM34_05950 [Woeseiaceae bacterium]